MDSAAKTSNQELSHLLSCLCCQGLSRKRSQIAAAIDDPTGLSMAQQQPKRLQHSPHGPCTSNNIEVHATCARDSLAKEADFAASLLMLQI